MSDQDPILEVVGVSKSFGGIHAVDRASLAVRRRSITSLIGPNGAGKSTLFSLVAGSQRPDAGTILLDGQPIQGLRSHVIARRGVGRTFQQPRALTRMTVRDNMLLAAPAQPGERLWRLFGPPRAVRARERQIGRRAEELLAMVDLDRLADDYAGTLSGGQRKLLEFARILMLEPSIVLLDEPMAGVNPVLGERLVELVQRLRAERGMTFLLVEHDLHTVMRVSEHIVVMSDGAVIAAGDPAVVRNDVRVVDAYLGTHGRTGTTAGGRA